MIAQVSMALGALFAAVYLPVAWQAGGPSEAPTPTASPRDCGTIATFADDWRPERELHVAPGGDDATGDGSESRPFASIGRAGRSARPGTAIRVHAGVYPGGQYVEGLRGEPGRPIGIGGVVGEAPPVLDGGGEGLHLVRPRYVILEGIEIRRSAHNGVNIDDGGDRGDVAAAADLVIRDLSIHDVGGSGNQDCLKLSGVRDFHVLDSAFARCGGGGSGSGIDMVGSHGGLIARNRFTSMSANAVQAKGGSSDLEIRWNAMRDAGHRAVNMGGSTGFAYFRPPLDPDARNAEARRIRVLANVIEGSVTPLAFVGCVDCLAAHNTVIGPDRWLLRILQETTTQAPYAFEPARDGRVVNNLFVFDRARVATAVNIGPDTAPGTFAFAHNLWFARDAPARSEPDLPSPELGGVVGFDPLLATDYTIGSRSPAARAGRPVAEVPGDAAGNCYREPPSIGAYEVP